jgi:hypothetical protein
MCANPCAVKTLIALGSLALLMGCSGYSGTGEATTANNEPSVAPTPETAAKKGEGPEAEGSKSAGGDESEATREATSAPTTYVDISDFGGIDQGAWYSATANLNAQFTSGCPSTFCQDTFPNLTPLTFNCTVTSKLGSVHDCAWTFAGSSELVDPRTAAISSDAPTYQCHVHPSTTAAKLLTFLTTSSDPIHAALPGTTTSIGDDLATCFQNPIGATTISLIADPAPEYVAASEYYSGAAGKASWQKALAAANLGFNDVCGDTFCGSDYGDLQSLQLDCAITKSTGNVKSCTWIFGGSFSLPGAAGALAVTSKSFACTVSMRGTPSQLISVLTAAGTDNPIQRPLPGETTSAYDAIANNCLP